MEELKSTPEEAMDYAIENSALLNDISEEELEKATPISREESLRHPHILDPLEESSRRPHVIEPSRQRPQSFVDKFLPFLPRTKISFYALIMIFASIFLLCSVYLGKYFVDTQTTAQDYDYLSDLKNQATAEALATDPTAPFDPSNPSKPNFPSNPSMPGENQPPEMLPDMKVIYNLNSDLVGWISHPALKIDYPVMQTPQNRDFYLYRDFYQKHNDTGCLYIRENCDVFKPSDNIVIYGHAMKTGDMFGRLYNYRKKSFWEKNQYFSFDTLYERHTYQIFAVFITSGTQHDKNNNPLGYPYHRLNEFPDAAAFDKFIADIKGAAFTKEGGYVGKSLYETGITPTFGDKLICLSTCEYTIDNGRLVVMGVRVS